MFYFFRDLGRFTTCFGQIGHLQVMKLCVKYVGGT